MRTATEPTDTPQSANGEALLGEGWGQEAGVESSEEEEAWEVGELTGQGVRPRTPAVGAAEAAGPTVTAEGHREGHHGVHARWTAGEADGGKVQLTVGAHRLRDGRQGSRQHPHLQARSQGGQRGRSRYLPGVEPHQTCPTAPPCPFLPTCPH